jgi:hypothetical protein
LKNPGFFKRQSCQLLLCWLCMVCVHQRTTSLPGGPRHFTLRQS